MKQALTALLMCGALMAQTKAPAKKAPSAAAQVPAVYFVKLTTSKGPVVIEVDRAWAPRGADRFHALVRSGFFTGAPFFRVIPNFMAQFGIAIKPAENKTWDARPLTDDKPSGHSNTRGMLTFATTGRPNSRGTQLFINYRDNSGLDAQGFLPIGQVVEGMEVMDQLYSGYGDTAEKEDQIENGGQPYIDRYMPKIDKIISATLVPAPPKPAAAPAKQ